MTEKTTTVHFSGLSPITTHQTGSLIVQCQGGQRERGLTTLLGSSSASPLQTSTQASQWTEKQGGSLTGVPVMGRLKLQWVCCRTPCNQVSLTQGGVHPSLQALVPSKSAKDLT